MCVNLGRGSVGLDIRPNINYVGLLKFRSSECGNGAHMPNFSNDFEIDK